MPDPWAELEAIAAEHDGIFATLEHPELPREECLEPMILSVEAEKDGLVMIHLKDEAANPRISFLTTKAKLVEQLRKA